MSFGLLLFMSTGYDSKAILTIQQNKKKVCLKEKAWTGSGSALSFPPYLSFTLKNHKFSPASSHF